MQKYKPKKISSKRKRTDGFIIDEAQIKVSSRLIWIWVAIEQEHRQILKIDMPLERNMLIAERFISSLMNKYDPHPVTTDGGTWYPQACKFWD